MRRSVILDPLVCGLVLALAGPVHAALITFEFGGQVTGMWDDSGFLEGRIYIGQPYSVHFTFDSKAVDLVPADPKSGYYPCLDSTFQMTFGDLTVTMLRSGIGVENQTYYDSYDVRALDPIGVGFSIGEPVALQLHDYTRMSFFNDSLPLVPPRLDLFSWRSFSFTGVQGGESFGVGASVTFFREIPEPATLLTITSGALGLIRRRRR